VVYPCWVGAPEVTYVGLPCDIDEAGTWSLEVAPYGSLALPYMGVSVALLTVMFALTAVYGRSAPVWPNPDPVMEAFPGYDTSAGAGENCCG
jgi:hypothetical protein